MRSRGKNLFNRVLVTRGSNVSILARECIKRKLKRNWNLKKKKDSISPQVVYPLQQVLISKGVCNQSGRRISIVSERAKRECFRGFGYKKANSLREEN